MSPVHSTLVKVQQMFVEVIQKMMVDFSKKPKKDYEDRALFQNTLDFEKLIPWFQILPLRLNLCVWKMFINYSLPSAKVPGYYSFF